MAKQIQEFTFDEDRHKVIELFTGKGGHKVMDTHWGGDSNDPIQITLNSVSLTNGDSGIVIYVEFKNPDYVVSGNSSLLRVAIITLSQVKRGECKASLQLLDDKLSVSQAHRKTREWLYGVAQSIATELWLQTVDGWVRQKAEELTPQSDDDQDQDKPWEKIPAHEWDQQAVKLLWAGYEDKEIADMIGNVTAKSVQNVLSILRGQYPKLVPAGEERRRLKRSK